MVVGNPNLRRVNAKEQQPLIPMVTHQEMAEIQVKVHPVRVKALLLPIQQVTQARELQAVVKGPQLQTLLPIHQEMVVIQVRVLPLRGKVQRRLILLVTRLATVAIRVRHCPEKVKELQVPIQAVTSQEAAGIQARPRQFKAEGLWLLILP